MKLPSLAVTPHR